MANSHVQGSNDIIIQASPQAVYKILTDGIASYPNGCRLFCTRQPELKPWDVPANAR